MLSRQHPTLSIEIRVPTRFADHPGNSAKTRHALRLKPDYSIGAGHASVAVAQDKLIDTGIHFGGFPAEGSRRDVATFSIRGGAAELSSDSDGRKHKILHSMISHGQDTECSCIFLRCFRLARQVPRDNFRSRMDLSAKTRERRQSYLRLVRKR